MKCEIFTRRKFHVNSYYLVWIIMMTNLAGFKGFCPKATLRIVFIGRIIFFRRITMLTITANIIITFEAKNSF